jgi:stage II sporulation protein AA (anti-sigma F factor antagonist)
LQVSFQTINRTLIARIEGELDHHTSVEIREKIDREINKNQIKNLIFDFEKLNFMDSSGIGVIIGRYKYIQKLNGKVYIANLVPQVERVITISGLHKIVPVFNNVQDALKEI